MTARHGRWDVVIVGSLANLDIAFAEALSRHGLRCAVGGRDAAPGIGDLPVALEAFSLEAVIPSADPARLFSLCRRAASIVTITGTLISHLGRRRYAVPFLRFPPIINVITGSDMMEQAVAPGGQGRLYRRLLRWAEVTWVYPYPTVLRRVRELRLRRYAFLRLPLLLPSRVPTEQPAAGPIVYLHASHIDWGETDPGPGRVSTKGTDRFLRAFIRAAREGADVRCVILDRGPDRHLARKLVERSGVADRIEWHPPVTQKELTHLYARADVVADQFDVGGFGLIALEAMAQGRPVMIWLDASYVRLLYDLPPPVLNCRTEEEIFVTIMKHQDRVTLREMGDDAEQWVRHNHGDDLDIDEFIFRLGVRSGEHRDSPSPEVRERPGR